MSSINRFDSHCHIFTLKYVLKEAKSMLHDMYHSTYPWEQPEGLRAELASEAAVADFKEKLHWLFELTSAALTTERRNLRFLQKQVRKAFPGDWHSIIPLMMDVFYIFAYPLDKDEDYPETLSKTSRMAIGAEHHALWEEMLDDLKGHITNWYSSFDKPELPSDGSLPLTAILSIVEQEKSAIPTDSSIGEMTLKSSSADYYHTEGFDYHLNNLMALVRSNRGELYPFIAVDPRRKGMIETVMSGRFFTGSQRFYGVKLYPRLGYHPQCKPLMPLYQYCADNGIPITFHCGRSGFPPGIDWKWAEFGNPINFEPIVKMHQNLRINFAHLGSSDPDHDWEKTIVRLVNENPNVYTDLSCYTNFDELNDMRKYWDQNPDIQGRLMYGTDFDVMYFGGEKITMQEYIHNFKTIFPDALERMMVDNPKTFLGVEEKPLSCLQKILLRWF